MNTKRSDAEGKVRSILQNRDAAERVQERVQEAAKAALIVREQQAVIDSVEGVVKDHGVEAVIQTLATSKAANGEALCVMPLALDVPFISLQTMPQYYLRTNLLVAMAQLKLGLPVKPFSFGQYHFNHDSLKVVTESVLITETIFAKAFGMMLVKDVLGAQSCFVSDRLMDFGEEFASLANVHCRRVLAMKDSDLWFVVGCKGVCHDELSMAPDALWLWTEPDIDTAMASAEAYVVNGTVPRREGARQLRAYDPHGDKIRAAYS